MKSKTKDYDLFVFRDDNRVKIDLNHIKRLVGSIQSRNLLELRPITVNGKMEIIDGQHRLLAAKELGIDIWYIVEQDLDAEDIIKMNIAKSWLLGDYLNFYVKHGYVEYIKLNDFMKNEGLNLQVTLNIIYGRSKNQVTQFKEGKFVFLDEIASESITICKDTIAYIQKMSGYSPYTSSTRFWKALITLVNHPEFNKEQWYTNMQKMVTSFGPKVSGNDYLAMFEYVYNWRASVKLVLQNQKPVF